MNLASILAWICLSTSLLVGACGNFVALEEASDAGLVDAPTVDAPPLIDAVPAVDADPSLCNPVTQVGCPGGQKCALVVEQDEPFVADTTCVADGIVPEDGSCSRGPAGPAGFDDCRGGLHCIGGVCTRICDQGPPDTCPMGPGAFDGASCTLFASLFDGNIGLCVPACDPTDDTVVSGTVDNSDCPADQGCYLNFSSGGTTCAGVPADAINITQNETCFGPGGGSCFLNGCDSGFAPLLPDNPVAPVNTLCSRSCTPVNTHAAALGSASGLNGKCTASNLSAVGGTNGIAGDHQCRFVQSLYNDEQIPAEVGMCVPIPPGLGGAYGDCDVLDWVGIQNAWNAQAPNGLAAAEAALEDFCFIDDTTINANCLGLFRGCISLAEKELGLDAPNGP